MAQFKKEGKTYVGSDWHGDYSIYVKAKEFMQPEDKLYYLGDAFDRGPCPIKLFLALTRDPQVTFVMGNHEEMAYNTLIAKDYDPDDKDFWFMNGGIIAYNQFYNIEQGEILGEIHYSLEKVYNDSYLKVVKVEDRTFFLSHAGFSFSSNKDNIINYVWDRTHIFKGNTPPEKTWIIHGHTPVQTLPWNRKKKEIEIDNYSPFKIDIDLGTWRTKKAALLCLNDLDNPIYITSDDSLNQDPEIYL